MKNVVSAGGGQIDIPTRKSFSPVSYEQDFVVVEAFSISFLIMANCNLSNMRNQILDQ